MSLWKDKPTYEYRQLDPNNFASQGLVGCWLLNENVGATAYDLSGNNNHGTLTSMANPPTTISGWAGQGLAFDGVDDYVNIGNMDMVNGISQLTISGWVKRNAAFSYGALFFKEQSLAEWIEVAFHSLYGFIFVPGGVDVGYGYIPMPAGTSWNFYTAVFDGTQTGNANRLKIYLNGVQQTVSWLLPADVPAVTASPVATANIGRDMFNSLTLNGSIDDVCIYNRALSASEIASLYEYPYQMIWKPRMIFINSLTPISLPMKMIIETTNRKNGIELINRNRDIAIIDRKNDITIN